MSEAITPPRWKRTVHQRPHHNGWQNMPVSDETLREIYNLMKWGPTSPTAPRRALCLCGSAEKKLRPALSSGNLEKTLTRPGHGDCRQDGEFYERLPGLFPAMAMQKLVYRKPRALEDRLSQQLAAGCLPDLRLSRAGAGHQPDVGL